MSEVVVNSYPDTPEDMFNGLNGNQIEAVTYSNGHILILAGAGSGKTKVLTTRISWLIKNHNVSPHEILAVTFTNKAAKEMLSRISRHVNIDPKFMWVGTFHAIALRILTKHHVEAHLPQYFQILDNNDQANVLKRIAKEFNLDNDANLVKELQKFINNNKENGLRSRDVPKDGLYKKIWLDLYCEYEKLCLRDGLVDFTELLLRSYELLNEQHLIRGLYNKQFRYILIDEFQDTNKLQYRWLQLLSKECNSVFAVGDDDQSIYSFRGARSANMQSFVDDYKIPNIIRLEQNYRSTTNILEAANAIISNNMGRMGKNLWTNNQGNDKIRFYEGYTEEDEAYFVIDEIQSLHNSGISLSNIAILYRSNAQSRIFEQFLYNRGLSYNVYGGLRFFDRQEIKHVLAYMRLLLNPHDNDAFLRVVNIPARGIGAKTIEQLQAAAKQHGVSLYTATGLSEDGKVRAYVGKFTNLIDAMHERIQGDNLPNIVGYIIEDSGLAQMYSEDKKNGENRLENLNELVSAVAKFKDNNYLDNGNVLANFLTNTAIDAASSSGPTDRSVQLMTVHAAKGLEFDVVFIVGLEEGLFPHENAMNYEHDIEEERRLMYVAVTRARKKLYLLRACSRLMWGKRVNAPVSRFINEIPSKLISNLSSVSKIGCNSLEDYQIDASSNYDHANAVNSSSNYQQMAVANPECRTSRVQIDSLNITVKLGDMVSHAKFGNGKIIALCADGKKSTADIMFINYGKKTLDLNIAKISKI